MTESSNGCTPLFFNADPTKMGLNFRLITQRRIASFEEKKQSNKTIDLIYFYTHGSVVH